MFFSLTVVGNRIVSPLTASHTRYYEFVMGWVRVDLQPAKQLGDTIVAKKPLVLFKEPLGFGHFLFVLLFAVDDI
jgi:hypothetical protein